VKRKPVKDSELQGLREKVKLLERIVELQEKLAAVERQPIYVPQPYPVYPAYPQYPTWEPYYTTGDALRITRSDTTAIIN